MELGRFGVWSGAFRARSGELRDAASELEQLGYSTLWLPGGAGGDVFGAAETLLDATEHALVATGILNTWMHDPLDAASGFHALDGRHPGRFVLGLGVSHQHLVDRDEPGRYRHPMAHMRAYLDTLDAPGDANTPVPAGSRVLAALGPRMLELARDRSAGAHPYNVTPEHTERARATLGSGSLLAPAQGAVLEREPSRARELARHALAIYVDAPNYVRNWFRLGFTEDDVAGGHLSDRLVDALVAWGSPDDVARRLRAHLDAGADHVCVQVLGASFAELPRDQWRELAGALDLRPA
jgi:probable F420-dependent oxidoreductase